MTMDLSAIALEASWQATAAAIRSEDYKEANACFNGFACITASDMKIYQLISPIFNKPYSEEAARLIHRALFTRDNDANSLTLLRNISRKANPSLRAHLLLGESAHFELAKPTSIKSERSQSFVLALFQGIGSAKNREINVDMIKSAPFAMRANLQMIVNNLLPTRPNDETIIGVARLLSPSRL